MPRPIIARQVANAAGACFAAGDSIRRVAAAIGVQPTAIKQALDRGRSPDAPPHLQRMKERYDAYQAEECPASTINAGLLPHQRMLSEL